MCATALIKRYVVVCMSDLMFVRSRGLNRMDGGDDVYWKSERMARQNVENVEPEDVLDTSSDA